MTVKKPKTQLADITLELLRNRRRTLTYEQISNDTGLTVSFLQSLGGSGDGEHASVSRMQALYEYLSGKPLFPNDVKQVSY
jgi:hypothetical protein